MASRTVNHRTRSRRPALSRHWRQLAAGALLGVASATLLAAADPQASRFYEDAQARFDKRDYAGAVVQLKNALQIDKAMLPVHVLLGKALLAKGDVIAAEVAFDEALRLGVNRAEVVLPLADAVVGQGKPQLLLQGTRFSAAGLPTGVRAQLLVKLAAAANDTGDPQAALKLIEEARAIDPQRADSWVAEVPVRLRARQIREATAAADRAVALAPDSAQAAYMRATVAHSVGDRDGALAGYGRALQLRPSHTESLVSRGGLLLDLGRGDEAARDIAELRKSSPDDPRGAYMQSLLLERKGDTAGSKRALADVTNLLDPLPPEFLRFRPQLLILGGLAHYGLGQREKAKPYLELAQRGQPGSAVSKVLAQIYLGEKNYDRAIAALDAYLKAHPNDTQAIHLLASAHMTQGRYARATALTQEALRRQDDPSLRGLLGLSLVGAGKLGDALTELEAAYKTDPSQVQVASALVSLYMQGGQSAKAVRVAEALVKGKPDNAGLHNLLGAARLRAADGAGARAAFERAAALDAGFAAPQVNLARMDLAANQLDQAHARLTAVLGRDEKYVEALIEMGRVHERRGQTAEAQRWYEKADDHSGPDSIAAAQTLVDFHLRYKQVAAAREAAKRLTSRAPEALPVLVTLAQVALANDDPAAARTSLTRAASVANYDTPVLVQIAMLQVRAGHLPGAAYTLDKALSERPDDLPALALLVDVEGRQGELDKAEARVRQILARHPKLAIGHALTGDLAMLRNQKPAALQAYRRAHQMQPGTDSLLRMFRVQAETDPDGANRTALQWLASRPGDTVVRRALADNYARTNKLPEARSAYEAVLRSTPNDGEVLNNLAQVMLLQKDPGALRVAESAMAKRPGVPHIIGTAGWAAFQAGQPDRALQLLRDARLRDPDNPETRYYLGTVLADRGRKSEAREELEIAVRSGRGFASAKQAEQLLETLK